MKESGRTLQNSESPPVIRRILEDINNSQGEFIALPTKTVLNEPLLLAVREGRSPRDPRMDVLQLALAVDRPERTRVLVGLRDWKIIMVHDYSFMKDVRTADGNFGVYFDLFPYFPETADPRNNFRNGCDALQVSSESFAHIMKYEPLYAEYLQEHGKAPPVEDWKKPIYQRTGLASLMIVLSLFLLKDRGVTHLAPTEVSPEASALWKKFSRVTRTNTAVDARRPDWSDYRKGKHRFTSRRKVADLLRSPYVIEVLERFFPTFTSPS